MNTSLSCRAAVAAAFMLFAFAVASPAALAHYEGELLPDSVAVMEYQMIINMKPDDTLTRNKLGMVYIRQNKLVKAREQFMEILKIDDQNFDALDSLGIVSEKEGKYREAMLWFARALVLRKDDRSLKERYWHAEEELKAGRHK